VTARFVSAEGNPAAGVTVYMVKHETVVTDGRVNRAEVQEAVAPVKTDGEGKAVFAAQSDGFSLLVAEDAGWAVVASKDLGEKAVQLAGWGGVEGELLYGPKPAPEGSVVVARREASDAAGRSGAMVRFEGRARTDKSGAFVIARVPAGMAWVVHEVARDGAERAALERKHVTILEGQKMRVQLGGEGRPVTGVVEVAAEAGQWVARAGELVGEGAPGEEAQAFAVLVGADGRFRVENVPAGRYRLRVEVDEVAGKAGVAGRPLGEVSEEVTVPADGAGGYAVFDVGRVAVKK
jgi:hypothetical protein